jgi:hypothetical protein
MIWVRRVAMICAAALSLALVWLGLCFATIFTEPEGNRAYAETWRLSPISELLQAQGERPQIMSRSDGAEGMVYRYHIGPWRGMSGRIYPGTVLGTLVGSRYMQSGVHLYTAPSGAYCDIDFVTNNTGVVEAIAYSGNDCG